MVLSDEKIKGYVKRLLMSRMRVLCTNGFYGLLIMHVSFALDEGCPTAVTDGKKIYFNPEYLDRISDDELDSILMHEIEHVVLQHCSCNGDGEGEFLQDVWMKRFEDACEAVMIRDPNNQREMLPAFARRYLNELKKPQTDWKTILNGFIQEEIADYSFMPPDRRMDDGDFFLPDFNDKEEIVTDVLFMIDTSASMSDDMITAAYSEVKGAIDQFDGKLKGWLGFFDAAVVEPQPIVDEGSFQIIRPVGGGGTDFMVVFNYVRDNMQDGLPACIIILTDGYAPFPRESVAMGIPVLWLLNNEAVKPDWGKVARIVV